jgi:uncharacterized protein DUF899
MIERGVDPEVLRRGEQPAARARRPKSTAALAPGTTSVMDTGGGVEAGDPAEVRPALAQLAADNLTELQRSVLDAAVSAVRLVWLTVTGGDWGRPRESRLPSRTSVPGCRRSSSCGSRPRPCWAPPRPRSSWRPTARLSGRSGRMCAGRFLKVAVKKNRSSVASSAAVAYPRSFSHGQRTVLTSPDSYCQTRSRSPRSQRRAYSAAAYTRQAPGTSALDDSVLHHTYSARPRGLDPGWGMYQWLDRAPAGCNENGPFFRRRGYAEGGSRAFVVVGWVTRPAAGGVEGG